MRTVWLYLVNVSGDEDEDVMCVMMGQVALAATVHSAVVVETAVGRRVMLSIARCRRRTAGTMQTVAECSVELSRHVTSHGRTPAVVTLSARLKHCAVVLSLARTLLSAGSASAIVAAQWSCQLASWGYVIS